MKYLLACYGTRGDVEPGAAVGRELARRGHEVCIAVPPDLVDFAQSAGLEAVAYGLETEAWLDAYRNVWVSMFRNSWRIQDLHKARSELLEQVDRCWEQVTTPLRSLADGAELLFTGLSFQQAALNIAEYYDIPLVTFHYHPVHANGQLVPFLPGALGRSAMRVDQWLSWRMGAKKKDDAQRRELGLPKATGPVPWRIADRGFLEIQAYDDICFPGLAAEWMKWDGQRPFVGALTMELPTDADEEAASWIAEGTPPIFFGFGSTPLDSPADTVAMISEVCAQLGERALVSACWGDMNDVPESDHVKVVGEVNFAAVFPACRAVVHHGGSGTTAIGLRAGVPTLILWTMADQPIWGGAVKRLRVGTARRFSATTEKSLLADLRTILDGRYTDRAREVASRMTKPAESVAAAADLLEEQARLRVIDRRRPSR
ncbi:glycosyltransferase [Mycobacterium sp. 1164985.4]|uniref:glycosyltransferase n=1 Tax=Mycobacterium sp. 1164985.4 TaxID=1834069 RepID=UPI000800AE10|nr:glycosyltransferase [Mycobacterium sp. 1164985.4]OBK81096.1 glycosyl transferase family 1 [Mycobacterium sp. 1164985.4]